MLIYFAIFVIILMLCYVVFLLGRIYECKVLEREDCDTCPAKEYCVQYEDLADHPTEKGGEEE